MGTESHPREWRRFSGEMITCKSPDHPDHTWELPMEFSKMKVWEMDYVIVGRERKDGSMYWTSYNEWEFRGVGDATHYFVLPSKEDGV